VRKEGAMMLGTTFENTKLSLVTLIVNTSKKQDESTLEFQHADATLK
jgi:hypothetical protein